MKAPRFYGLVSSRNAFVRSAPRSRYWLGIAIATFKLTLPQLSVAQTNPPEEPIAAFPEQSNAAVAPAQTMGGQPSLTTTQTVTPSTSAPAPTASTTPASATTVASPPVAVAPSSPFPNEVLPTNLSTGPSREGFYFRFSAGPSLLRLKGTGPHGTASIGGLGSVTTIAIGGGIARGLVLYGTIHAATTSAKFKGGPFVNAEVTADGKTLDASNIAAASIAEIGAMLDYYPSIRKGWHVGLGLGLGSASIVNSADNSTYYATGLGALIQGGYDWHLGKDWCLGLNLTTSVTTKADFKESKHQKPTDYSMRGLSLGVQSALVYF